MSNNESSYLDDESVELSSDDESCSTEEEFSVPQEDAKNDAEKLAQKETRAVRYLRAVVVTVMGLATTVAAIAVFYNTNLNEINNFRDSFADYADSLDRSFGGQLAYRLNGVDHLAAQITTHALTNNLTFPNVTIPDFSARGVSAILQTDSLSAMFAPLVTNENKEGWESYSVENQGWLLSSIALKDQYAEFFPSDTARSRDRDLQEAVISPTIFTPTTAPNLTSPAPWFPLWQMTPVGSNSSSFINGDLMSVPGLRPGLEAMLESGRTVVRDFDEGGPSGLRAGGSPIAHLLYPVFDSFDEQRVLSALVMASVVWEKYLANVLPDTAVGIICVLENACNQVVTYRVDGPDVAYLGRGDMHNENFESHEVVSLLNVNHDEDYTGEPLNEDYCPYKLRIYPSSETEDYFRSNRPLIYTAAVVLFFLFTGAVLIAYDVMVERRQQRLMKAAVQSNAIVASMFPAEVRERLYAKEAEDKKPKRNPDASEDLAGMLSGGEKYSTGSTSDFIKSRLEANDLSSDGAKPIADLFPSTTILFADISGFTAWSSERDPEQVFILLESLYGAFDTLAKKRGVFKVETIGDCYVAITGCPQPQSNHAVIMARFARDIIQKAQRVTRKLEATLGPDTGELSMRVGLHSGPVTAGVLRGEKARFQLFGDTVNTAARMESNGIPNLIHASQETADLLSQAGKSHWVNARQGTIFAKGKGDLQTFWVDPKSTGSTTSGGEMSLSGHFSTFESSDDEGDMHDEPSFASENEGYKRTLTDKCHRLVHWNTDLLFHSLKQIVAQREASLTGEPREEESSVELDLSTEKKALVLDEVADILHIPRVSAAEIANRPDVEEVKVAYDVKSQLKQFVELIASMYRENAFHNFEHASHVLMSVNKMMKRINAGDNLELPNADGMDETAEAMELQKHTFGISTDPMLEFALMFSALIHDVDHAGVSNFQLVKEEAELALRYKNKSVLEQNSVDVAWDLLMMPGFADLRACLFPTEEDLRRFRQLVVNIVIATDIFDRDLSIAQRGRWERAFGNSEEMASKTLSDEELDLNATIIIEHIIQASDVAHTMQHWNIYQKWNKNLFEEMYQAHMEGRMGSDPSRGWYKGELMFFDNYVIPLARKLQGCEVFGMAGDQCLRYAMQNRKEWETKGREVVQGFIADVQAKSK